MPRLPFWDFNGCTTQQLFSIVAASPLPSKGCVLQGVWCVTMFVACLFTACCVESPRSLSPACLHEDYYPLTRAHPQQQYLHVTSTFKAAEYLSRSELFPETLNILSVAQFDTLVNTSSTEQYLFHEMQTLTRNDIAVFTAQSMYTVFTPQSHHTACAAPMYDPESFGYDRGQNLRLAVYS